MRNTVGNVYWPKTRIRKNGMAAHQQSRMRGTLKGVAVYLVIFLVFALGYVWARIQVVETGYRLRRLEEVREKLREENQSLTVEAATLRSPQRLESLARNMGLKRPTESQVKFLNVQVAVGVE